VGDLEQEGAMKTMTEVGAWRVTTRINQAGNLTIEVELRDVLHADLVLQESGVVDLGTKARPWDLGDKGWGMPGAPSPELRKYRFEPEVAPGIRE
jgi:hypothetical protein